jgi:hypothetical protein
VADEAAERLLAGEEAALADVPGLVVALHYRSRYGRETAAAGEVAEVERRLAQLERAVGRGLEGAAVPAGGGA